MKTVWKFLLPTTKPVATIDMPADAKIIHVGQQGNVTPTLWALVDPSAPVVSRKFAICGTGHPVPSDAAGGYVGTCHVYGGSIVLHVFEFVRA